MEIWKKKIEKFIISGQRRLKWQCQKWKFRRNEAFSVHFNFEKELKTKEFEEKIEIEKFSFGFRKKKTEMIVRNLKMWKKWVNGLGFFCLKLKKFRKNVEKMLKKSGILSFASNLNEIWKFRRNE